MCVEGAEENNNDIKIREPPVSFRSGFLKHFSFRVNVHNGKEVVEKEIKTVCKICHNGASYKSGNICNMSSHLKRKHGIGFSSTASPSASNNSKYDTSVSTLLFPRQRQIRPKQNIVLFLPPWQKSRIGRSEKDFIFNLILFCFRWTHCPIMTCHCSCTQ